MKKVDAKDVAVAINTVIQKNPNFKGTRIQLLRLFAENNVKTVDSLWYFGMRECFHVEDDHTRSVVYSFQKDENDNIRPIYFEVIERAQELASKYNKKMEEFEISEDTIAKYIEVLKARGYKVYKPVTEYKEM